MALNPTDLTTPLYLINYKMDPPTIDMEFTRDGKAIIYNRSLRAELVTGFRIDIREAKENYNGNEVLRFPTPACWEQKKIEGQVTWVPRPVIAPELVAISALYKRAFVNICFPNKLNKSEEKQYDLVLEHELPQGIKKTEFIPDPVPVERNSLDL